MVLQLVAKQTMTINIFNVLGNSHQMGHPFCSETFGLYIYVVIFEQLFGNHDGVPNQHGVRKTDPRQRWGGSCEPLAWWNEFGEGYLNFTGK